MAGTWGQRWKERGDSRQLSRRLGTRPRWWPHDRDVCRDASDCTVTVGGFCRVQVAPQKSWALMSRFSSDPEKMSEMKPKNQGADEGDKRPHEAFSTVIPRRAAPRLRSQWSGQGPGKSVLLTSLRQLHPHLPPTPQPGWRTRGLWERSSGSRTLSRKQSVSPGVRTKGPRLELRATPRTRLCFAA